MGARIEPWGTPQESLAGNEEKWPNMIEKLLFVKYDLYQLRQFPGCPQNILVEIKGFYDQLYQKPRLSLTEL